MIYCLFDNMFVSKATKWKYTCRIGSVINWPPGSGSIIQYYGSTNPNHWRDWLVGGKFVTKKLNSVVSRSYNYEGKREISERASLEFGEYQEMHSVTWLGCFTVSKVTTETTLTRSRKQIRGRNRRRGEEYRERDGRPISWKQSLLRVY